MKFLPTLFALSALLACHSETKPHAGPVRAANAPADGFFDLSACAERPMTPEEFVKRCQEATAANFTYALETAEAMHTKEVHFDGPAHLAASELEHYLTSQLARSGLSCRQVGPPTLRVFVVERSQ